MDGDAPSPLSVVGREPLGIEPLENSPEMLGKLEWRCRRGMKELDLVLARYLHRRYATASSDERVAFAEFLELPDPDIARYLIAGDVPDDPRHAALCRTLVHAD
jgi:antitoxin CptB